MLFFLLALIGRDFAAETDADSPLINEAKIETSGNHYILTAFPYLAASYGNPDSISFGVGFSPGRKSDQISPTLNLYRNELWLGFEHETRTQPSELFIIGEWVFYNQPHFYLNALIGTRYGGRISVYEFSPHLKLENFSSGSLPDSSYQYIDRQVPFGNINLGYSKSWNNFTISIELGAKSLLQEPKFDFHFLPYIFSGKQTGIEDSALEYVQERNAYHRTSRAIPVFNVRFRYLIL